MSDPIFSPQFQKETVYSPEESEPESSGLKNIRIIENTALQTRRSNKNPHAKS